MAGVVGIADFTYQEYQIWTPLQRWYFNEYSLAHDFPTQRGNYWLLTKTDRAGHHSVASNSDVVPDFRGRHNLFPFELSQQARQQGAVQLNLETVHYSSAQMEQILREQIFAGQSTNDLLRPSSVGALGFFVVGLLFVILRGRVHRRRHKDEGTRLKGPEMVTVKEFNRRSAADGINFLTTEKKALSIPRSLESSHIMIMGDTGAGKSVLQRRILTQVAERGETAIVYDPALEYTPQFFNADRGDLILNPLDARCPYWSPSDEVIHDAEALTLATSLFPEKPHENTFFVEGPQKDFRPLAYVEADT